MSKITIISTEQEKKTLGAAEQLTPVIVEETGCIVIPTAEFSEDNTKREIFCLTHMIFKFAKCANVVKEIREIEIKVTPA